MDTRYWGPSGWRLLHLISFAKAQSPAAACRFFETLPYVLPCKYCRKSLSEYITEDPVDCAVREHRLSRWLWRIHNDVNAKLRAQRIPTAADPPFERVRALYEERLAAGCSRTVFDGWEFLFSVAEAHPMSRTGRSSAAIDGHPPADTMFDATPLERNRWNMMLPEERLPFYQAFWEALPAALPFPEWRAAWRRAAGAGPVPDTRAELLKWLWGIRCRMETELDLLNRTNYSCLCKELREMRSGCGSSRRGRTCRRKR